MMTMMTLASTFEKIRHIYVSANGESATDNHIVNESEAKHLHLLLYVLTESM
jgi:hypothetical protein